MPMPIRPYLGGRTFDPETIAVMSAALEEACRVLQVGDVQSRKRVANTIIALADNEKTADMLAIAAIGAIRGAKSGPA
jgi:hypothetical protein